MPKKQGPQSFAKRERERAKQAKRLEKQQRRFDKKTTKPDEYGHREGPDDADRGDEFRPESG